MKKRFLLFVLLIISQRFFAQIGVSGIVQDTLHQPVAFANVIVKHDNKIIKNTITNKVGYFELQVHEYNQYIIKIISLGYQSLTDTLYKGQKLTHLKYLMRQSKTALKEVVINAKLPDYIQKKDTIVFNLKALTDGSEMTLKDIVQKLPGIRIDEEGKIKKDGKTIDKVLINNKEFFNRQHQMATENITSDMVSGIQYYNRFKTDFDAKTDSGIRALNVDLKKKYLGKTTGNVILGLANDKRYKAHVNVFNFSKNANIAFITDVNNLGQKALTINDYIDFTGGIERYLQGEKHIGNIELNEDEIPSFLLKKDDVKSRNSNFAGLNIVFQKQHKYKFSGFYLYNNMKQEEFWNSHLVFNNNSQTDNVNKVMGHFSVFNSFSKLNYKLSDKNIMTFLLTTNLQKTEGADSNQAGSKELENNNDMNNLGLGSILRFNRSITDSKIWDTKISFNYKKNRKKYAFNANYPFLDYLSLSNLNSTFDLSKQQYKYNLLSSLSFLREDYSINFGVGARFSDLMQNSNISDSNYKNTLTLTQKDVFVKAKIKFDRIAWHFTISSSLHHYNLNVNNVNTTYNYISPFVSFTYLFSLNHTISVFYNYDKKPITISDYFNNYYFYDRLTLMSSNLTYKDALLPQNLIALDYNNYISKYKFYYSLNINYNFTNKFIQDRLEYLDTQIQYYKKTISSLQRQFSTKVNFNKFLFKHYYFSFEGQYDLIQRSVFYDSLNQVYENQSLLSNYSIYSRYKKSLFNISFGLENRYFTTNFKLSHKNSLYKSYEVYVKLNGKIYKHLKWNLYGGYESLAYIENEHITRINAGLQYQLNNKVKVSLVGYNVLNLNTPLYTVYSSNENYEQFNQMAFLPGYISLNFTYNY